MRAPSASLWCLVALAAAACGVVRADEVYRSNAIGMRLGPAADTDGFVLKVHSGGDAEDDVLLDQGSEVRRTVRVRSAADGVVKETVSEQGAVTATRTYDATGRLIEETNAEGRRTYRYRGELLESMEVFGPDGKPSYRERYGYTPRGRLREAERTYGDGSRSVSSFLFADGRLMGERLQADERVLTVRYDSSGRLAAESEQQGGALVWERTRRYDEASGRLAESVEKRKDYAVRIRYDAGGRLVEEDRTGAGAYRSVYAYDGEGRRVRLRRVGSAGTEEWQTQYDDAGRVSLESYVVRGLLQRVRVHTGEREWHDDLYRDGQPVLRVTYRDDVKVGEERLP